MAATTTTPSPLDAAIDEAIATAEQAGLRYTRDDGPGIRRRRAGTGWSYRRPDGTAITDRAERARLASVAIPPAWTDVWISPDPDGHILATGRDARGRKQYRYHPRWREVRDADKFDRMAAFGLALPELRRRIDADLGLRGLPRDKVLATVVRLLDETLIRVGNAEYANDNESYGLTTITPAHVDVTGPSVRFRFRAKSGVWKEAALRDRRLATIIRRCEELPGQDLFQFLDEDGRPVDVTSGDVNAYLRDTTAAPFTAKDFRTWGGTVVAAEALVEAGPAADDRAAEQAVLAAYDEAAATLGNTRTVCRNCYVHPKVPDAYRQGTLADAWRVAREVAGLRRAERAVLKVVSEA